MRRPSNSVVFDPAEVNLSSLALAAAAAAFLFASPALGFDSDDYNRLNLDTGRWTFVNPLGDGTVAMHGAGTGDAHVVLSVPVGPSHDPWQSNNKAVRIMQPIADTDFELEAKFDSEPSARHQLQGFIVEQDNLNWLRFDVYHDGTSLRIFAGVTLGGSSSSRVNAVIASGSAAYLRVTRVGDQWTLWRSADGLDWFSAVSFAQALSLTSAGVFAANHAGTGDSPAYSAVIDYCYDNASPLTDDAGETPADTLPPFIHRIEAGVGPSELQISWGTDERAMGTVEYGTTMGYELGSMSDGGGLFEHTIALPGLQPGETYHYRISSEDSLGQTSVTGDFEFVFDPEGPLIDVWYGSEQSSGHLGQPQPWVNVLGNVSDSDGVSSLEYTLNGSGPVALSIGPDGRRLLSAGDFNIDLATSALVAGANTVVITAADGVNNVSTDTVTVNYQPAPIWPLPFEIHWDSLTTDEEIQTVAHVVDGKWTLDGDEVRTAEPGYDRLIAAGDASWDDYEVLVPITFHTQPGGYGAGILFRWNGHTDSPVICAQPKCGWLPLGAILWATPGQIEVYGNGGSILDTQNRVLAPGIKYWFRGRVQTNGTGGLYQLRVWEDGQPEPAGWDISGQELLSDPQNGSMMLISHQADVSFGPVTVTALPDPPNTPPTANDDTRFLAPLDSLDVDVLANDTDVDGTLDLSSVEIVSPPIRGIATVDTITGKIHYVNTDSTEMVDSLTYTVRDNDGALSNEATLTFILTQEVIGQVVSDDFNDCQLDTSLWSFVNPYADGSYALVGGGSGDAHLALSLPLGSPHDAWGPGGFNEAIRVMQPVVDTDFDVVLKFNAEPTAGFNDQGFLAEQDEDNWMRYDIYHDGAELKSFIGTTTNGANTTHRNATIPVGTATHLRIQRVGNTWNFWRSNDGESWISDGSVVKNLNVGAVGVYAANPIGALAFTSEVDYFFNPADPIASEDGQVNAITLTALGNGAVTMNPSVSTSVCGEELAFTAVPDSDWVFIGWSGDLSGSTNPETLVVAGPAQITAHFEPTVVAVEPGGLAFALHGARPNPFGRQTSLSFTVPAHGSVRLAIYGVSGRLIRTLVQGEELGPGQHNVVWDGRDDAGRSVRSGVYLCRLSFGAHTQTRRMVFLK